MYQDVVASLYQRNSLLKIVEKTASVISIPLTVGGGIRTIKDISDLLESGADKVALNTSAIKNPKLIEEAAKIFGSSTIVVAIETSKDLNGNYLAYTDNGREFTGIEVTRWSKEVENRGAGEIFLTSIDKDGTGDGFDNNIINIISDNVSIPVIAHGGAGNKDDVINVIKKGKADAVVISSLLHYNALKKIKFNSSDETEGNVEFISKKKTFKKFGAMSVVSLKKYLKKNKILVRI
jgi:cyclase